MNTVGVGLVGLGTVGTGVVRLLDAAHDRVALRAGRPIVIERIAVRDLAKPRSIPVGMDRFCTDWRDVIRDPAVQIVVELIGGIEPSLSVVREAIAAGKHVVTANKALLAEKGTEIFDAARRAGRAVVFEGSVAGGIPIVQAISGGLAANQIQSIAAILNGTCNFILTAMTSQGLPYDEALGRAQAFGYAESDPSLDVDGTDTAHKLAILAQLAFGATVTTSDIPREGIDRLDICDIRYAAELGYTIKLLASARLVSDGSLALRVAPRLVKQGTPLADVRGAYNAIRVVGDPVGDTLFYGPGAGAMPTASAVVGDLIDIVSGRAERTFQVLQLWRAEAPKPRLAGPELIRNRYYLRFMIADRPGVLGRIAQVLGDHRVSIASVIQHDPGADDRPDAPVPLVLMTHRVVDADLQAALAEIDRLDVVKATSTCYGVED